MDRRCKGYAHDSADSTENPAAGSGWVGKTICVRKRLVFNLNNVQKRNIFQNNAAAIPAAALHYPQSCRTITIRVSFCTLKSSYFTSYEEDSTMEKRENETLTVQDIKQILNISINAAYNLIHSKSFPVIRIGNSFRVPREPFYEWMKSSHTIMN